MPELPEVETIRRGLEKYLVGKTIIDVKVRLAKQISGDTESIKGAEIQSVRRFGKGLVIDLSNNISLAIHVKMTGQLIYSGPETTGEKPDQSKVGSLPGPHTHVIFHLKSAILPQTSVLYYNDIRQFGWIKIVPTDEVAALPFFKALGPEPLKDLDLVAFSTILSKAKTPIKTLLMDQSKMAGIGNIYANDALFLAKIHPKKSAILLSEKEKKDLFDAIEAVLKKGIEVGGSSEWQYVNALGQTGGYQNLFQIYGRVGKPCRSCGTTVEKMTLGGRGTFFCPSCQQLPK